jgi:hypothetical protein
MVAFKFNLRRYNEVLATVRLGWPIVVIKVGRCRLTVSNPSRKRAWFQRLKLKCDEPLLTFAFNFNLRRYIKGTGGLADRIAEGRSDPGKFITDPLLIEILQEAGAYTRPLFGST